MSVQDYVELSGRAEQRASGGYWGVYLPRTIEVAAVLKAAAQYVHDHDLVSVEPRYIAWLKAVGCDVLVHRVALASGGRYLYPRVCVPRWIAAALRRPEGRRLVRAYGTAERGSLAEAVAETAARQLAGEVTS